MRTHCKRLARLTLAFSKKLHNFKAAMSLNLAYYNLVKTHGSLRCTPAMAAGVETARGRFPISSMPPESLEEVIKKEHGCDSVHVRSEPLYEAFQGLTAWQGTVEVFDLIGHPKAKRAYVWQYEDDDKRTKTVTVLEIPPVDSAQTAVKAAIVAKARSHGQK